MIDPRVQLNIPFPPEKQEKLAELIEGMEREQLFWLHGYLQALLQTALTKSLPENSLSGESTPEIPQQTITILFGTHTGNCRKLSQLLLERLGEAGIIAGTFDMDTYRPRQIANERYLLIIVSTHGEGTPPLAAEGFYEYIHGKRVPLLETLNYAVLALGDRSYFHFCKTGADIDSRLEDLKAKRIIPRADCDIDFTDQASAWIDEIVLKLKTDLQAKAISVKPTQDFTKSKTVPRQATRQHPVEAEIAELINLNGRGSSKSTYHIEMVTEPGALHFKPGDALGIWPKNDPALAGRFIDKLPFDREQVVNCKGEDLSIINFLTHHAEITSVSRDTLERYHTLGPNKKIKVLLEDPEKLRNFLRGPDFLDLLHLFPSNLNAQQIVDILRPLQPRLYSIASSLRMFTNDIHLTVGLVRYNGDGRIRKGAGSSFLGERVKKDDKISVFVEENENFRLPVDAASNIIMIGPGTGMAPFRAFMQEREITGGKGKNWFFYGDRNFSTDFLYQTDWQTWRKKGLLTHIDLAFSRDQSDKIYVQNKLKTKSKQVFKWIEEGASVYVCGDSSKMAPDVQKAFTEIIRKEAGKSPDDARAYIKELRRQKRYLEDVY